MVMFHCHVSFLDGTCTNKTLVSCDVLRFSISHFLFRLPQICQSWCFSHSWEPNPPTESKKWKKSWRGVHPLHHPAHEVSPACLMLHQQNRFYIRLTSTELVLRFHVYIYIYNRLQTRVLKHQDQRNWQFFHNFHFSCIDFNPFGVVKEMTMDVAMLEFYDSSCCANEHVLYGYMYQSSTSTNRLDNTSPSWIDTHQ